MIDLGFIAQFGSIVTELSRLTGLIFINTKANSPKPIDRSLRLILDCNQKGQHQRRDYLLAKVALLVKNLQEIENCDNKLFQKCISQLLRSQNDEEYYGARFEISITADLVGSKVNFLKQESPDFKIHGKEAIYLECTSAHVLSADPDYYRKVEEIILRKATKSYCTLKTALLMDITNICCVYVNEPSFSDDNLSEYFEPVLEKTNFGSLLFFLYYVEGNTFAKGGIRIDNSKIDSSLESFIDVQYPDGKINPEWVPHEG